MVGDMRWAIKAGVCRTMDFGQPDMVEATSR